MLPSGGTVPYGGGGSGAEPAVEYALPVPV